MTECKLKYTDVNVYLTAKSIMNVYLQINLDELDFVKYSFQPKKMVYSWKIVKYSFLIVNSSLQSLNLGYQFGNYVKLNFVVNLTYHTCT